MSKTDYNYVRKNLAKRLDLDALILKNTKKFNQTEWKDIWDTVTYVFQVLFSHKYPNDDIPDKTFMWFRQVLLEQLDEMTER